MTQLEVGQRVFHAPSGISGIIIDRDTGDSWYVEFDDDLTEEGIPAKYLALDYNMPPLNYFREVRPDYDDWCWNCFGGKS